MFPPVPTDLWSSSGQPGAVLPTTPLDSQPLTGVVGEEVDARGAVAGSFIGFGGAANLPGVTS